ncbi:hypothetical protein AB0I28_00055 [Phytomonospora sp. NPDC050363]|uniref:hypothetical protein n=1 Tax=Phytomonospora sp. NPDC050363 TaxID=3155642 RepID=UPI0033ECF17E
MHRVVALVRPVQSTFGRVSTCPRTSSGDPTVEAIAVRVGLGSAVNLRRRFRGPAGTTPSAYRRTFDQP